VIANIANAAEVAQTLIHAGVDVYCPHVVSFLELFGRPPPGYERMMEMDFNILGRCDALLRLRGESAGSDREVAFAREHGIPVHFCLQEVIRTCRS
jgi:hypothetical protein